MNNNKSRAGFFQQISDFSKVFRLNTGSANYRIDTRPAASPHHQVFHLLLIKPTRYDDDGYPIQWVRSSIPSNSLACLNGLALDAAARRILGDDVEIRVSAFDEACDILNIDELIERIESAGQRMLVCMAGVQSNQFPRAMDVSRRFAKRGVQVCIGGFHVSGVLSVLGRLTPELEEAQQLGISLFAGEAESGRFDSIVKDAWARSLKPLYDYCKEMVTLEDQPRPVLPDVLVKRNFGNISTIDLGRGCPFHCSFFCIINVADNLKTIQKRQNKITDYRKMLLEWKRYPVVIWGAYIIGFPNDTYDSVLRDIDIIKRELPIDILNPSILTPLPGSMDHKQMTDSGEWMDPDLNRYDLSHRVTHHPKMTDDELDRLYKAVWDRYYTPDHMVTVIRRAFAIGSNKKVTLTRLLTAFGVVSKVTGIRSYDMGLIRYVARLERRPGLPIENPLLFYPKMAWRLVNTVYTIARANQRLFSEANHIWKSPERTTYRDEAITPVAVEDYENLDMYQQTRGVKEQAEKAAAKQLASGATVFFREA